MTAAGGRPGTEQRGGAPETVGQILARVTRQSGLTKTRRGSSIADLWSRAAGPELDAETRPSTLRQGVLTIEVRSAALLAELAGFRTDEMLTRLLAEDSSGRFTGLKFRLGVF